VHLPCPSDDLMYNCVFVSIPWFAHILACGPSSFAWRSQGICVTVRPAICRVWFMNFARFLPFSVSCAVRVNWSMSSSGHRNFFFDRDRRSFHFFLALLDDWICVLSLPFCSSFSASIGIIVSVILIVWIVWQNLAQIAAIRKDTSRNSGQKSKFVWDYGAI